MTSEFGVDSCSPIVVEVPTQNHSHLVCVCVFFRGSPKMAVPFGFPLNPQKKSLKERQIPDSFDYPRVDLNPGAVHSPPQKKRRMLGLRPSWGPTVEPWTHAWPRSEATCHLPSTRPKAPTPNSNHQIDLPEHPCRAVWAVLCAFFLFFPIFSFDTHPPPPSPRKVQVGQRRPTRSKST